MEKRNVLVTGASRGIGLGIAVRLARAGYRVLAVARKSSEVLDAAIQSAAGAIRFEPYDLSATDGLGDFVRSLRQAHGPVYGLVNNAGISHEGALAIMPTAQIEQMVRVNVLSPMILTKYVVRSMLAEGGGRVVNISSITASAGYAGLSVYSATKASLAGFTRSLAREAGKMGVNVNAVAPGFVDTDLTKSLGPQQREQIVRRSALRRLATVEDVAAAVEFLLSDGASNITGTVVTVDAGSTA